MKLATVNISEISIGKRFRDEFEGQEEGSSIERLAHSMKTHGIIQPIAVKETEDGYYLLAGERRIKAAILAEISEIPIRIYDEDLSDLEMRSIELSENLWRKNFTPIEKANIYREMNNLQIQIHGVKTSTSPDASGWSASDTAEMLGVSQPTITEAISLAETMEAFPDVEWDKMKNTSEAMKTKKKLEEGLIRSELAKRYKATVGSEDQIKTRLIDSYLITDFFKGVKTLPDLTFDFVEIDPPYAIDLKRVKKQGGPSGAAAAEGLDVYNEVTFEDYPAFMMKVFEESYRVMKPNSWMICWFGPDPWFEDIHHWITMAGFTTTRLTGVWEKGQGQTNNPSKRLANATEHFFYCWKGAPVLARPGMTNEFRYSPVAAGSKLHPTERPIEMMRDILTTFTAENSRVLVPFAGSGNTGIACAMEKMIPVMFDLEKSYKEGYIIKVKEML